MVDAPNKIPTIWGGISTQDKHIRHINQVEDANGIVFDIRFGADKTGGSDLLTNITGLITGGNYRIHTIKRDHVEKYIVIYGEGILRVFDMDGVEITVNFNTPIGTYITAESATADDMRFVTIADFTIITNTLVTILSERSPSFSVAASFDTYDDMIRTQPLQFSKQRTTNPTPTQPAGFYEYIHGPETFETWQSILQPGSWVDAESSSTWQKASNNPMGFTIGASTFAVSESSCVWDFAAKTITKVGAFAGYTFASGDQLVILSGSGIVAGFFAIASKTDDDTIVMIEEIDNINQTNWVIDGIGQTWEVTWDLIDKGVTDHDDISDIIQSAMFAAGGLGQDTLTTFILTNASNGDGNYFLISPTRGTEGGILGLYAPTTAGVFDITTSGLPFNNARFTAGITAGTGSPTDLSIPKEERWERTAAPSQDGAVITATTMPVQMVRIPGAPVEFDVDLIDWNDRTSGDSATNKLPNIWDGNNVINDLVFQRNRLLIGSNTKLIFSQSGDFFNFFLDDELNIVDSDPIDVEISSNKVSEIEHLVPFHDGVIVFTKSGQQFDLVSPEILNQETVSIIESTDIQTQPTRPVTAGNFAYFIGGEAANTAQMFEYSFEEAHINNDATEITTHVHGLMPETIKTIGILENTNTIVAIPDDGSSIFIYRFHYVNTIKEQSAWSRTIISTTGQARVADLATIDDKFVVLIEIVPLTRYSITASRTSKQVAIAGMPFAVKLSNQQTIVGVTSGGQTTFTQPANRVDILANTVVLGPSHGVDAGTAITPVSNVGGVVTIDGEFAGESFVGSLLSASLTLTQFFQRDSRGIVDISADLHVESIDITFIDTGTFTVTRTMANKVDAVRTFDAGPQKIASGVFRMNLNGRASDMTIVITSADHRPMSITSVQVNAPVTKEII